MVEWYTSNAVHGGWSNVVAIDTIPKGFVKKTYRDPDNYKALFRDFNAIMPGVQEKRPS